MPVHVSFLPRSPGLEDSTAERNAFRRADHFAERTDPPFLGLLAPSLIVGDQGYLTPVLSPQSSVLTSTLRRQPTTRTARPNLRVPVRENQSVTSETQKAEKLSEKREARRERRACKGHLRLLASERLCFLLPRSWALTPRLCLFLSLAWDFVDRVGFRERRGTREHSWRVCAQEVQRGVERGSRAEF